jgi:hypothetical protein
VLSVLAVGTFAAQLVAGSGVASASDGRAGTSAAGASMSAARAGTSAARAGTSAARAGTSGARTSMPAARAAISGARAGTSAAGGTSIGPAQINALGRPDLCWQANGNGAPVTLESCQSTVQAQQWSLTGNGVLMNGIGYCLEARTGEPSGTPLYIDFAGQCGGSSGQIWQYSGTTGQLSSGGTGICAVSGGSLSPGTEIVRAACRPSAGRSADASPKWSLGYSSVSLQAGRGSGPAGGAFSAFVTAANAASAQAAYGMTVAFRLPRGLTADGLHVTGGTGGWSCHLRKLTCSGTLLAGTSGQIEIAGRLPAGARGGSSYAVSAGASVAGTSPGPGPAHTTASVRVAVRAAAADGGTAAPGASGLAGVPLTAVIAGALLIGGGLLVGITRRPRARRHQAQRHQARRHHAQGHPARRHHAQSDQAQGHQAQGQQARGQQARGRRGQRRRPPGLRGQGRRADANVAPGGGEQGNGARTGAAPAPAQPERAGTGNHRR